MHSGAPWPSSPAPLAPILQGVPAPATGERIPKRTGGSGTRQGHRPGGDGLATQTCVTATRSNAVTSQGDPGPHSQVHRPVCGCMSPAHALK